MVASRQYDTVAFDVRDNATRLFFAKNTDEGDIADCLLLMPSLLSGPLEKAITTAGRLF